MSEHVFKLPDLGEGAVEAEIVEWLVQPGDRVREGDSIACVLTEKANVEVPAPVDGLVLRTSGKVGETVAVGAELAAFETEEESGLAHQEAEPGAAQREPAAPPEAAPGRGEAAGASEAPSPAPGAAAARRPPSASKIVASPALRRRAKESGVELAEVPGSGPGGRILAKDLEAFLARKPRPEQLADSPPKPAGADGNWLAADEEVEAIKPAGVRRAIARRMAQSKREIPHFTYVEEVDVTELQALRRHLREAWPEGPLPSLLPFVCFGLIRALAEFPQCNAVYDAQADLLRRHRAVHLGLAVHTSDGLKAPVVRDAHRLKFRALSAALADVAQKARENRLPPAQLTGSTITVSSLGKLGGIVTTPILNHPEVAIVGLNRALERPAVLAGQVVVRSLMNLSSSFDHRFVDGHDAAAMIQRLKTLLEHPAALFMPKRPA